MSNDAQRTWVGRRTYLKWIRNPKRSRGLDYLPRNGQGWLWWFWASIDRQSYASPRQVASGDGYQESQVGGGFWSPSEWIKGTPILPPSKSGTPSCDSYLDLPFGMKQVPDLNPAKCSARIPLKKHTHTHTKKHTSNISEKKGW